MLDVQYDSGKKSFLVNIERRNTSNSKKQSNYSASGVGCGFEIFYYYHYENIATLYIQFAYFYA